MARKEARDRYIKLFEKSNDSERKVIFVKKRGSQRKRVMRVEMGIKEDNKGRQEGGYRKRLTL